MEPLIDPWMVYLINTIKGVNAILITTTVVLIATLLIFWITYLFKSMNGDYEMLTEEELKERANKWKKGWKHLKLLHISAILFLIISLFTPSRNTLLEMYVANQITSNTINSIIKTGKNVKETLKQDIIDIIKEINKE